MNEWHITKLAARVIRREQAIGILFKIGDIAYE